MTKYDEVKQQLKVAPKVWLVTGVAGFIGSNLLETLLQLDQYVVGLDNFSTGFQHNLDEVQDSVTEAQWQRFQFVEGDICDLETCNAVMKHTTAGDVNYVLHQAALGSVPRSIDDPIKTNKSNIDGFLNILVAAKDADVDSFTYAASSSTYGDHPALPKVEENIGNPLSPYAVTKYVNELYASVFTRVYGFKTIGLRYFNVFGPRQNPDGAYAAVIPKWIEKLINDSELTINGNGYTTRDFTYIDNAIQANILAATTKSDDYVGCLNIAKGMQTSLLELIEFVSQALGFKSEGRMVKIKYAEERIGDVRHSLANIEKAKMVIGYEPNVDIKTGIEKLIFWRLNKKL